MQRRRVAGPPSGRVRRDPNHQARTRDCRRLGGRRRQRHGTSRVLGMGDPGDADGHGGGAAGRAGAEPVGRRARAAASSRRARASSSPSPSPSPTEPEPEPVAMEPVAVEPELVVEAVEPEAAQRAGRFARFRLAFRRRAAPPVGAVGPEPVAEEPIEPEPEPEPMAEADGRARTDRRGRGRARTGPRARPPRPSPPPPPARRRSSPPSTAWAWPTTARTRAHSPLDDAPRLRRGEHRRWATRRPSGRAGDDRGGSARSSRDPPAGNRRGSRDR